MGLPITRNALFSYKKCSRGVHFFQSQEGSGERMSAIQVIAEEFASRGFACVDNVIPIDDIDRVNTTYRRIHFDILAFHICMTNFNEVLSMIEAKKLEFGIGSKNGFSEIVQRHLSRFEVPYKMKDIVEDTCIFNAVAPYAYHILGPDAHIVNCSLVVSRPGSSNQSWHVDGPHLSSEKYVPCHCLNIFIPLIDMAVEHGPTEFRPCSQYLTRDLSKMYLAAFLKKRLEKTEAPLLNRGSILLFDYRTLHRGLANTSDIERPVFVLTFALPWFKDVLNFPPRSVSDPVPAVDNCIDVEAADEVDQQPK